MTKKKQPSRWGIGDYQAGINAAPWMKKIIDDFEADPDVSAGFQHRFWWRGETPEEALFLAMLYATLHGVPPRKEDLRSLVVFPWNHSVSAHSAIESLSPHYSRRQITKQAVVDKIWSRWVETGWAREDE